MKEYKLLSTPDMKVEETINKATPQHYSNYAQSLKRAEPYENIVRNVNNQLNQLIKLCQADYKTDSLEPQDKEFLPAVQEEDLFLLQEKILFLHKKKIFVLYKRSILFLCRKRSSSCTRRRSSSCIQLPSASPPPCLISAEGCIVYQ